VALASEELCSRKSSNGYNHCLVWLWLRRSFAVVSQVMVRTIVLCFSFVLMWMFWILMMKHSVAAAMAQYSPPICYGESSGKSWNLVRPFSRPEGHGK